jgi:hypothetical protein
MVDRLGFRSIFVLSLVVGVAALGFAWKAVPADQPARSGADRMDWLGAVLLSSAAVGINLFIGGGGREGWFSTVALGWVATAVVAMVAFVIAESRVAHPLLAIEHLRSREVWPADCGNDPVYLVVHGGSYLHRPVDR